MSPMKKYISPNKKYLEWQFSLFSPSKLVDLTKRQLSRCCGCQKERKLRKQANKSETIWWWNFKPILWAAKKDEKSFVWYHHFEEWDKSIWCIFFQKFTIDIFLMSWITFRWIIHLYVDFGVVYRNCIAWNTFIWTKCFDD